MGLLVTVRDGLLNWLDPVFAEVFAQLGAPGQFGTHAGTFDQATAIHGKRARQTAINAHGQDSIPVRAKDPHGTTNGHMRGLAGVIEQRLLASFS